MSLPERYRSGDVGRELGGMLLSSVQHGNAMLSLRAARWHRTLWQVGVRMPFWVIHDLGMMALVAPADVLIAERSALAPAGATPEVQEQLAALRAAFIEIGESEVMERARAWGLTDALIAVLLLKILAPIYEARASAVERRRGGVVALPLEPDVYETLESSLASLFAASPRGDDLSLLAYLARSHLRLVTAVEQVDLDTLRLVGMFGDGASAAANSAELLDLLGVFESPGANDIVNFSLDLLPSVLETKRASGTQSFSVDGYSGVQRRGTIDSLVLSELAFDPELFARRFAENEVFYYAREKEHEEDRRLHYIVVDASASMRGRRATFARGLALTLIKKLTLRGEDVYFRFFDSQLYDVQRARPGIVGSGGGINVPYLLCFQGERGRNYPKVFGLLANELARVERRERRNPILYFLTHAECHVPVDTIERMRRVAKLYGIFMLPSTGELDLDYLNRLHTVQVVDEAALKLRDARARRALDIVEDAAREETRPATESAARSSRASIAAPPPSSGAASTGPES